MAEMPNEQSQKTGARGRVGAVIKIAVAVASALIAIIVTAGFVPGVAGGRDSVSSRSRTPSDDSSAKRSRDPFFDEKSWEDRARMASEEEKALREGRRTRSEALREILSESDEDEMAKEESGAHQKIRRFEWESPAEARGKLWNVPEEETEEATQTAFLRVCMSEADGHAQDCIGIWQVIKNIRRRECERGDVRRITECVDGGGETYLSVMKRASKSVLGVVPPRSRRSRWISELELSCEQPPSWPGTDAEWERQYGVRCPRTVELSRYLVKGELPPGRNGQDYSWLPGIPITWGGRCENKNGACDDRIACARGLARIEQLTTHNAFWCRPGTPGCRQDAEPICVQLGYGSLAQDSAEGETEQQPSGEPVATSEPQEPQQGGQG